MKEFELISTNPIGEPRETNGRVARPLRIFEVALTTKFSHEFYPLQLFVLAGALERSQPKLHEMTLVRAGKAENIIDYVKNNNPDILAISAPQGTLETLDAVLGALAQFEAEKLPKIILGHSLPSFLPERFLKKHQGLPITIVTGWGEDAFAKEVMAASYGDNFSSPKILFGTYPESYPYQGNIPQKGTVFFHYPRVETSKGCFWGACSYCLRTGDEKPGKWKRFEPEDVLKQISELIRYGYTEYFEFADEEPLGNDIYPFQTVVDGLIEIKNAHPELTFGLNMRADHVISPDQQKQKLYDAFLERAKRAGLSVVWMGAESYSHSQLKKYNKGPAITPYTNLEAARKIHDLGINVLQGFIPYHPLADWEELTEMANFMTNNMDLLSEVLASPFGFLRVQYHTPYEEAVRRTEKDSRRKLLGELNENMLTYDCKYLDPSIGLHVAYMRLIYDWINPFMKEISVDVITDTNGENKTKLKELRRAGLELFLQSIKKLYPLRDNRQQLKETQQEIIDQYKRKINNFGINIGSLEDFMREKERDYLEKYVG